MSSIRSQDDEAFKTTVAVEQVRSEENLFKDDQIHKQPCFVKLPSSMVKYSHHLYQSTLTLSDFLPLNEPIDAAAVPTYTLAAAANTASVHATAVHNAHNTINTHHATDSDPTGGNHHASQNGDSGAKVQSDSHVSQESKDGGMEANQAAQKTAPKGLKNSRWAGQHGEVVAPSSALVPALSTLAKTSASATITAATRTRPRLGAHHTLNSINSTLASAVTPRGQRREGGRGGTSRAPNTRGSDRRSKQSKRPSSVFHHNAPGQETTEPAAEEEENPFKGAVKFDWDEFHREVKDNNLKTLKDSRWA
ncbi:hypothetical protein F5Y16DRAFT_394569 [Xylariaceae sp. FL0255]|nr:hypothetical protein F5Y16DRAFT_394569 [Xylariaceae sp. FL0255]